MVEKFKQILQELVNTKGPVNIFAILKMDEIADKWTVILSAPWSNDSTRSEDFAYLRGLIHKYFTTEELANIARMGLFPKESSLINTLLKYTEDTDIVEPVQINGNLVHAGHIFTSNPNI